MKKIFKLSCLIYGLTILANLLLIMSGLFAFAHAYGPEKFAALLLAVPPILSLMVITKQGDKEERQLKKRIRKAHLRKELDELKQFDVAPSKKDKV